MSVVRIRISHPGSFRPVASAASSMKSCAHSRASWDTGRSLRDQGVLRAIAAIRRDVGEGRRKALDAAEEIVRVVIETYGLRPTQIEVEQPYLISADDLRVVAYQVVFGRGRSNHTFRLSEGTPAVLQLLRRAGAHGPWTSDDRPRSVPPPTGATRKHYVERFLNPCKTAARCRQSFSKISRETYAIPL